jgi:hypothetical protein
MPDLPVEVTTPGPGQCILHNLNGRLFVERADPVVAFTQALVAQIRAGTAPAGLSLDGDTLVIDGSGGQVFYRLEKSTQPGYLLGKLA